MRLETRILMGGVALAALLPFGCAASSGVALFESVEAAAPAADRARSRGVAWGDFDGDGDPDLFVTRATYDTSAVAQGNVLYRNDGDGRFSRVDAAPTTDREGDAEGAVWVDIDNDGDLDLHVVGRTGTGSILYENDGSTLTRRNVDPLGGGAIHSASMACWADVDVDGWLDVFIVGYGDDDNALFRNAGDWDLQRVALPNAARGSGDGRACSWGDLDGDHLPELVVAMARRPNLLLRNRGGFDLVADTTTALYADDRYGYGLSWTDVNGDGARDLFVANFDAANAFHIGSGDGDLEGVRSNRMGVGARVSVLTAGSAGPRWQHRWLDATTGYAGQDEPVLHFGLGSATRVECLVVQWPSGAVDRTGPLPVGVVHTVREGDGAQAAPTARAHTSWRPSTDVEPIST